MKSRAAVLILFLFATGGCLTDAVMRYADAQMEKALEPDEILKSTLQGSRAPNWMPLHTNPKPGDYAVHRAVHGNDTLRIEVKIKTEYDGVDADRHKIRQGIIEYKMKGKSYPGYSNFQYLYYADADGNITRAEVLDLRDKKIHPWKVASQGDAAFVADHALVRLKTPSEEQTPAGPVKITDYIAIRKRVQMMALNVEGTGIHLVNPGTPFMIVRSYVNTKSNLNYSELSRAIGYWDVAALVKAYVGELSTQGDTVLVEKSR